MGLGVLRVHQFLRFSEKGIKGLGPSLGWMVDG